MFLKLAAASFALALPVGGAKVETVAISPRGVVRRSGKQEKFSFLSWPSKAAAKVEHNCHKQHPAYFADVENMTSRQIMDCYVQFHEATLAAWRAEPQNCKGRHVRFFRADHGFGDTGGAFLPVFRDALVRGEMMFWLFPTKSVTVWQLAMKQPFEWSLNDNKHLLCIEDDATLFDLMEGTKSQIKYLVGKCPNCKDPRDTAGLTPLQSMVKASKKEVFKPNELFNFLYRPTNDVQNAVQEVLGQVKHGERLVGVHFRSQWFGTHHACGCLDTREAPRCMMNIGHVMKKRNISGFEDSPRLRYFVASDEFTGVDAYREAFGHDVLSMPDKLPLEHSLFSSAAGAKRLLAEFLILSKATAILGTCGSTFTEGVMRLSGLKREATIITGTEEARACSALKNPHQDLSAFNFSRFSPARSWGKACYCYGAEDEHSQTARGGTCEHACHRVPVPPHCPSGVAKSLAEGIAKKPEWVPQKRVVAESY